MSARMRIVPLPSGEYGVLFDRTRESDSLPPMVPVLDDSGAVVRRDLVDMKAALRAHFVLWFDDEIELAGDHD